MFSPKYITSIKFQPHHEFAFSKIWKFDNIGTCMHKLVYCWMEVNYLGNSHLKTGTLSTLRSLWWTETSKHTLTESWMEASFSHAKGVSIKREAGRHIDINSVWSKALRLSNNIYLHAKPGMRIHSRICHLRKVVWLHKSLLVFFCFCAFYFFWSFYVFISFYVGAYHSFDVSLRRISKVLAHALVLQLT